MATMDTCGAASRFSVLKIEDDDEEEQNNKNEWTTASKKKSAKSQNQTKANKSKKKKTNLAETIHNVVGLQPVSSSVSPPLAEVAEPSSKNKIQMGNSKQKEKSDDEWKKHDEQFVANAYISDLQSAIIESRKAFKQEKNLTKLREAQVSSQHSVNDEVPAIEATTATKKCKKQKKKQQQNSGYSNDKKVMSLEEFQQGAVANQHNSIREGHKHSHSVNNDNAFAATEQEDEIDTFDVADEASKILDKERRQEALKQTIKEESTLRNQYKHEVEKKTAKIKQLQSDVKTLQGENEEIKKRNKLLCNIMAQGEMKEKGQLLKQMEDLLQVKDELTAQLIELHGDLERERSKNRKLEDEIKRLQKRAS